MSEYDLYLIFPVFFYWLRFHWNVIKEEWNTKNINIYLINKKLSLMMSFWSAYQQSLKKYVHIHRVSWHFGA